jgi:hypothetical protein
MHISHIFAYTWHILHYLCFLILQGYNLSDSEEKHNKGTDTNIVQVLEHGSQPPAPLLAMLAWLGGGTKRNIATNMTKDITLNMNI